MLEPPPTATYPSNRPSTANLMASLKEISVGSTRARSNSTASIPADRSASRTIETGSLSVRFGSVTTITRPAPSLFMSWPTSRVTPEPNLMLEESIVKAVSSFIDFPR